jgi:hypothetical protein
LSLGSTGIPWAAAYSKTLNESKKKNQDGSLDDNVEPMHKALLDFLSRFLHSFSKVLSIVPFYRKCTTAMQRTWLTQNFGTQEAAFVAACRKFWVSQVICTRL